MKSLTLRAWDVRLQNQSPIRLPIWFTFPWAEGIIFNYLSLLQTLVLNTWNSQWRLKAQIFTDIDVQNSSCKSKVVFHAQHVLMKHSITANVSQWWGWRDNRQRCWKIRKFLCAPLSDSYCEFPFIYLFSPSFPSITSSCLEWDFLTPQRKLHVTNPPDDGNEA